MSYFECISLDYQSNLQDYYQKLSHLPGFVCLESTDTIRGRYDIVSACPYEQVRFQSHQSDLQQVVADLSRRLCQQQAIGLDLPFQGGAIGFISYDFGELLYGLAGCPQPGLVTLPILSLGFYDWALIADHHKRQLILFFGNQQAATKILKKDVLALLKQPEVSTDCQLTQAFTPLTSQAQYESDFHYIQAALKAGRSYQVNYTQSFQTGLIGDPWAMYRKISGTNPVPFSAFIRLDEADILSFSPERFLLYQQGDMLTSPIKGTITRSDNPILDKQLQQQLSTCPKNRAENVMIVDLLRNDLSKIAEPGSVNVQELCTLQSFNYVHHLVSEIRARCLNTISPFAAFMSCFPGGSITGAPKLETMRIIRELEPYSRGVYCGSIGYFSNHGRFDTNIAIRTLTAKDQLLHLAAGGGIVIDSNCQDEYRECYTKIAAITKAFA